MSEPAFYRPNVDDSSAYREALDRAVEAAETDTASGETPEIPELETVPVSASDQPLVPEPEVTEPAVAEEVAEETPETQQQEAPVVGIEDLRQQLAAAQARLEEKDSFIGRQSSEVGELRQAITEMQQHLATREAPAAPTMAITQDMIDTNPALAAQSAYAQGNTQALEIAFEAWKDEDPFAASSWRADRLLEKQQADFEARIKEVQAEVETAKAPLAESRDRQEWDKAFAIAKTDRPDFIENAARLLEEVAPLYPTFLPALQNGDAAAKAEALSALYALDKMGNPQAVQAQLAEQTAEAAVEAAAALQAASAVSGQTTIGQAPVEKTFEQSEQEAYATRREGKPSLAKGWTGRS